MKRFKILFINPSLSRLWGGTTFAVLNLFYSLRGIGVDIELWSARTSNDEILDEVLNDGGIKLFSAEPYWRYSSALRDELERRIQEFDLVHIHGMWLYPHFVTSKVANRAGIPYIISPHGMIQANALKQKWLKKKVYWWLLERNSFKKASLIHTIVANEYEQARKLAPMSNASLLPNGIKLPSRNPKASFPDEPVILFIGRLHQTKGVDKLIVSLRGIPMARLIIAGDGDVAYKNMLFRLVDNMKLTNRVEFVGFVNQEQKEELYQKASFLALASYTEVMSLVALEAIAHGLPVLITKACDFDDVGRCGAGVVIDDNEPQAIVDGVSRMMSLDLSTVSQRAFSLAEKYSLQNIAQGMLSQYELLLSNKQENR